MTDKERRGQREREFKTETQRVGRKKKRLTGRGADSGNESLRQRHKRLGGR